MKLKKNAKNFEKKQWQFFNFSQFEYELFWRYFKRLNVVLAQCGYCVGKWKSLSIVDEGVNSETHILFEYWDFYAKSVDEVWYLPKWIAWDSFEFDKTSRVSRYSFPDLCCILF